MTMLLVYAATAFSPTPPLLQLSLSLAALAVLLGAVAWGLRDPKRTWRNARRIFREPHPEERDDEWNNSSREDDDAGPRS